MHDGGGGRDGGEGQDSLGLTKATGIDKILTRPKDRKEISIASKILAPLKRGVPVALEVDDPRLPKRKRIEKPLLFLTPQSVFGVPSRLLIVSLQTYGCEVIDTSMEIKPLMLVRVGLSARMAGELARELDLVFKRGNPNGSKST